MIAPIRLEDDKLFVIDQRRLPAEEVWTQLRTADEVYEAIRCLAVRGAPAIGIAAGYGVFVALKSDLPKRISDFRSAVAKTADRIGSARPTAYNLFYALERMKKAAGGATDSVSGLQALKTEAIRIHEEDLETGLKIGKAGAELIRDGDTVLTHCNAGALATGGNGTALAAIFESHRQGKRIRVVVDETRPLLQGARLTAWELMKSGIECLLIADSMSGTLMRQGKIDLAIVGADRIAANGDFANKIGTYTVAALCKMHGLPFYTAAPSSTFDLKTKTGKDIPIEERDADEVRGFAGTMTAPEGCPVYNPSFDVTPSRLLSGIVTEKGVIRPPFCKNIQLTIRI